MYNHGYQPGRAGGGGGTDLPQWQWGMPSCGTNRAIPGENVANGYDGLPRPHYHNTPGAGFQPGPYDSPAYMYPQTGAYGPYTGYPGAWGPQ
ncbi:hypothetical protein PG997_006701 [Apiospora hydei]|uniref:Uncharacterized protein n=1 Tax=Apiospora hydei TaxID=1337664 RepID=A0ABR1WRR8_9PEZI